MSRNRTGVVVAVCATLTYVFASPGQTYGISLFTDALIRDLGVSRSELSVLYMAATGLGATALPIVGKLVDRAGVRRVAVGVGVGLSLVLALFSRVASVWTLFPLLFGTRLFAQGSLGLVASHAVAQWWERRRGLVMGISFAVSALLIAGYAPLVQAIIERVGWRQTWLVLAAAVLFLFVPIAAFGLKGRGVGPHPDPADPDTFGTSMDAQAAWRTGGFWLVTISGSNTALIATALAFHQISILGERGLDPGLAAANFLPQFLTIAGANVLAGWLLDRLRPRVLIAVSQLLLGAGCAGILLVTPGAAAVAQAVVLGLSLGIARSIGGVALPRYFGVRHLGAIQGRSYGIFVACSAMGPLPLALVQEQLGSYTPGLLALAVLPVLVGLVAPFVREPDQLGAVA